MGQKNSLTRVWGQTGSRPVAPKDLGFASAYVFGAVCPSAGKARPGLRVWSRKIGAIVRDCAMLCAS